MAVSIRTAVAAPTNRTFFGGTGRAGGALVGSGTVVFRTLRRSGKSGGKNAKIITQAESATPIATSEPSCARPGRPPKLSTTKAAIVVVAAQNMLGAMARRISGTDNCG